MVALGKNYQKGDPLRGAAILALSLEQQGLNDEAARSLLQGVFADLGVKEKEVRRYLRKHRDDLLTELAAGGENE